MEPDHSEIVLLEESKGMMDNNFVSTKLASFSIFPFVMASVTMCLMVICVY